MKRIGSIFVLLMVLITSVCYAEKTDQELVRDFKSLYEAKAEIDALNIQRREEEEAIVVEYKVRECNQKRKEMLERYQSQLEVLYAKIATIEKALGEK